LTTVLACVGKWKLASPDTNGAVSLKCLSYVVAVFTVLVLFDAFGAEN